MILVLMRHKNTVTKYIGIFAKNDQSEEVKAIGNCLICLIIHIAESKLSARLALAQSVEHETVKLGVVGSSTTFAYTLFPIIEWIYLFLGQNTPLDKTFLLTFYLDPWLTLTFSIHFLKN